MIEREQVPEGGWYTEEARDANGVQWWCINERREPSQGEGDTWVAQTGIAMEEVADEICRLHNAFVNCF